MALGFPVPVHKARAVKIRRTLRTNTEKVAKALNKKKCRRAYTALLDAALAAGRFSDARYSGGSAAHSGGLLKRFRRLKSRFRRQCVTKAVRPVHHRKKRRSVKRKTHRAHRKGHRKGRKRR